MKKITCVLLAALLVFAMVACGGGASSSAPSVAAPSTSTPASVPASSSTSQTLETDVGLFSVDILLPGSLFTPPNSTAEEYAVKAKEMDGVLNAEANDDGSVTLTLTKQAHTKMLDEMKDSMAQNIEGYTNGTDFPSIKTIEHDAKFSKFVVTVDKAAFEGGFDGMVGTLLGLSGVMYLAFDGQNDGTVTVEFVDEATGEVFDTRVYPDAWNDA